MTRISIFANNQSDNISPNREDKGKSLLESLNDYTAIDLETTGLDSRYNDIIEVAAVRVRDGKIVERTESLINPGYEIDEFITELTGITNEMLSNAPSLSDVLPGYIGFLGDDVIIAHNANFDINFIYDSNIRLANMGFINNFVDTMRVSRRMFKEHRRHTLTHLIERFGISRKSEHRAMSDTELVFDCYEYMKKHASDNGIDFNSLYPSKNYNASAKDISTENTEFDEDTLVFGNEFVFTGTLDKMNRKEAMQYVVDMGGLIANDIKKTTNYLVLGNLDYSNSIKEGKSRKQKKAEALELSGVDIQVISENVFYEMINQ